VETDDSMTTHKVKQACKLHSY